MVERAEQEPTMAEIVVALRETRRDAGRVPPFTVVGGQPGINWASGAVLHGREGGPPPHQDNAIAARTAANIGDIADLRGDEIERLLVENARLNERIVFLLKVIERDQADKAAEPMAQAGLDAVAQEVKTALEVALRPIMQVFLHMLEKQHVDGARQSPAAASSAAGSHATSSSAAVSGTVPSRRADAAVRAARPVEATHSDLAAVAALPAAALASVAGNATPSELSRIVARLPVSKLAPYLARNPAPANPAPAGLASATEPEPQAMRAGSERPAAPVSTKGARDRRRER